jgi:hypothetical protein
MLAVPRMNVTGVSLRSSKTCILILAVSVTLSGCSNSQLPEFSTDGVTAPPAQCAQDPREFGQAESLGSYGEGACTVKNAWKISAIDGIFFSQPAIVNCAVANGFRTWLADTVQPAAQSNYGAKVTGVTIAASYACRPRNGVRGAKISEHAFGNAIDVAGFSLSNGRTLNVENDYYGSSFLKQIRIEACGLFKTVLGPGSDSSHRDHLHFDLATRRSGQNFCH